jgi:probable F420-dependent oxidoreductase
MAELKVGVAYHRFIDGYSPAELARDAEALGLDSVWVSENTFSSTPKTDPFVALGAFAAVTTKPLLGTSVVRLPLRSPIAMAKACACADRFSKGRFVLGVGVGGEHLQEFEASGIDVRQRGARTDECLKIFKELWTSDRATFKGRFFQFENINQEPKPVQPGGPPIWVGGRSEAAMRRVIRYGHGFYPYLFSPTGYKRAWERLQELAHEMGRNSVAITRACLLFMCIDDEEGVALRKMQETSGADYHLTEEQVRRLCVFGPPSQCIEALEAYVEAGLQHVVIGFGCPLGEVRRQLERLGTEVIPHFKRKG